MAGRQTFRLLAMAATLVLFSAAFTSSASAQSYACPTGPGYGERIIGMQGNLPLCEAMPADATGPGASDPMEATIRNMAEVSRGLADSMGYMLSLAKEIGRIEAGGWKYSSPGQSCSATFISPAGFVRIDGPTKTLNTPLLTFYSTRVANPNGYKTVDIAFENTSLDSGEGASMAVKGLNWSSADGGGGFLSLQLAATAVLVRGLEDNMGFKLSVAGKPVVNISWNGGNEAKAKLAKCLGVKL